jgi:hypothetical protein
LLFIARGTGPDNRQARSRKQDFEIHEKFGQKGNLWALNGAKRVKLLCSEAVLTIPYEARSADEGPGAGIFPESSYFQAGRGIDERQSRMA